MKKINRVLPLALLIAAPAVYAQHTDTKAAPDVPIFSVTLNVTNGIGGVDSLLTNKKNSSATAFDSLLFRGNASNWKLVYGTPVKVGMKAEPGKMLSSFVVNGEKKTFAAQSKADASGTVSFDKVNLYSIELGAINSKTDIAINWVEKPEVKVTVTGTEQIVKEGGADAVTVTTSPVIELEPAYFSDKACTQSVELTAMKAAGTYYVKLSSPETADYKAINMVIPMVVNNKTAVEAKAAPTCETVLLAGQPLSAAVIKGSEVTVVTETKADPIVVKGTWAWVDPNATVKAGTTENKYDAIFTPDQAAIYNTVTAKVGVAAKPVMEVTVKQTAGGVVAIENAAADNRYIGSDASTNPKITVTATPDAGYKFTGWVWTGVSSPSSDASESKVTSSETTITTNTVVSATFVKATRAITISTPSDSDGTLRVLNGTQEVKTNDDVAVGTALTIVATPAEGKITKTVGYTKTTAAAKSGATEQTSATSFIVSGAAGEGYTIAAEFANKPVATYTVKVAETQNGALKLKTGDSDFVPGGSVASNGYISIIAMPNRGYKLSTLTANGTDIKANMGITVTNSDVNIAATFEKESYQVDVVKVNGVNINVESGKQLFGTQLSNVSVTETDPDNYRFLNLLVNNKPVANGSTITVEGNTNITAQVQALTPLTILNEAATTVTYSGKAQNYAVHTASGLGGFNVKYLLNGTKDTIPVGVGTYTVQITRPADNVYAAITEKAPITRTLTINAGVPGINSIPFADKAATASSEEEEGVVAGSATVAGKWMDHNPRGTKATNSSLRADGDLKTIYFVPDDENFAVVAATTPADAEIAGNLNATVALPAPEQLANGTLSLMNGSIPVDGQTVYAGQELQLVLTPDAGYMRSSATISVTTRAGGNPSFSLQGGQNTITATGTLFTTKATLSIKDNSNNKEVIYTGKPIVLDASDLTELPQEVPANKWKITYKKDGSIVNAINVIQGSGYDMYVSSEEGATYQAVPESRIGKLTVKPATITDNAVTVPTASAITTGETLLASSLTGGKVVVNQATVPGIFAWKDNTEVIKSAGTYNITFTPTDQLNYSVTGLSQLSSYVSLKDVVSYAMTVKTVNTGSITMKDASGATIDLTQANKIAAGMKLFIETAATGTKIESITVNPETTVTTETTGSKSVWSFIAPAQDFTVTVTFTKESTSDGGNTPSEGTPVTAITLNKSTLTLPRTQSEKLVATVAPTGATKKDVKWTSTNPAVATVDADGTVKAIAVGKATIVATTVDGGFTAMCEVTVDFATSMEEALANTSVMAKNGMIYINPMQPLQATIVSMNGKAVYDARINGATQIQVVAGVYIVKLTNAGSTITTKISVF